MKVAIFVPRSSSIIYHWLNFAKILHNRGHEIFFITHTDAPLMPENIGFDFKVEQLDIDPSSLNLLKQISETRNLIKILNKNEIEVIHAFYLKSVFLTLLSSFFTKTKNFLHVCGLGNLFNDKSLKNLILSKFVKYFFALSSNLSNRHFVVETSHLKKKLKSFGLSEKNIFQLCGVGIDTEKFKANLSKPSMPIKFITVSRLLRDKGMIEYMDAVESVTKEFSNVEFTLVGMWWESNPQSISNIEFERLKNLKINYFENINNVNEVLPKFHYFILPSYHEGLSVSSMEAASCGLGLILSDISGCRELVHENENGYLFNKQDSNSLIQAIHKGIANFDKIETFASNSRSIILENHSVEILDSQVRDLYEQNFK